MYMDICGGEGMYLPTNECEDCAAFEARIQRLEEKLDGLRRVPFSKTDGDSVISGFFLGRTENG